MGGKRVGMGRTLNDAYKGVKAQTQAVGMGDAKAFAGGQQGAKDQSIHQGGQAASASHFTAKGFCFRSRATVVNGPCPGQRSVSAGRDRIFWILRRAVFQFSLEAPPMLPAKSASPTKAMGRSPPSTNQVIPPGE